MPYDSPQWKAFWKQVHESVEKDIGWNLQVMREWYAEQDKKDKKRGRNTSNSSTESNTVHPSR